MQPSNALGVALATKCVDVSGRGRGKRERAAEKKTAQLCVKPEDVLRVACRVWTTTPRAEQRIILVRGRMDDWIVVLDDDAASRAQLEVCQALRPSLKGAVKCDATAQQADVCQTVDFFPAFCHAPSNACVYGVRRTEAELQALVTLAPPAHTRDTRTPPSNSPQPST